MKRSSANNIEREAATATLATGASAGVTASSESNFRASLRQPPSAVSSISRPAIIRPRTADFQSLTDAAERVKERTRQRCEEHFKRIKSNEDDELYSTSTAGVKRSTATRSSIMMKQQQLKTAVKSATEDNTLTEMAAAIPSTAPRFALFPVAEQPMFPARTAHAGSWTVGLPAQYRHRPAPEQAPVAEEVVEEVASSTGASLKTQLGTIRALGKLKNSLDRRPSSNKNLLNPSATAKEINAEYVKLYASKDLEEPSLALKRKYFGIGAQKKFYDTYRQLNSRGTVLLGGYEELSELIVQPQEESALAWAVQQLEASGVLTPRQQSGQLGLLEGTASTEIKAARSKISTSKQLEQQGLPMRNRRRDVDAIEAAVAVAELYSQGALPSEVSQDLEQRIFNTADDDAAEATDSATTAVTAKVASEPNPTHYNITRLPPIVTNTTTTAAAAATQSGASSKWQLPLRSSSGVSSAESADSFDAAAATAVRRELSLRAGGDDSLAFDDSQLQLVNYDDVPDAGSSNGRQHRRRSRLRGGTSSSWGAEDLTVSIGSGSQEAASGGDGYDSDSSIDLDKPMVDSSLQDSYSIGSPRAIFLAGCLQEDIPPMTQALLRRRLSSSINLAHMGIGNKVAAVLATCLPAIPYLQLLNLMDNNLDDGGLSVLIRSVAKHQDLEILDISQNIIGSEAAEALAEFIGKPQCRLQCLRMSNANIDDGECANFVDVLMHNQQLKELDMSNNLLGKDENLNTVQPDFVTGGESLAELLKNPECPLQKLNLHWNMIRLEGAEVLCDSLRTNRVLTHLDLSYNALGSNAACILGSALIDNNVLTELNVANNGIEAWGSFTLLVGVRENSSLRKLTLDGNPIGEQGGRVLIQVAAEAGNHMNISASSCDFTIKYSTDKKFNVNNPFGDYLLDLSVPFERAIAFEMLHVAAADSAVQFSYFEYAPPDANSSSGGGFQPVQLHRYAERVQVLPKQEQRELRELRQWEALAAGPVSELHAVAAAAASRLLSHRLQENPGDRRIRKLANFAVTAFSSDVPVPKSFEKSVGGSLEDAEDALEVSMHDVASRDVATAATSASAAATVDGFDDDATVDPPLPGKLLDFAHMKALLVELKIRDVMKTAQEIRFALDSLNTGYFEVDELVEYIVNRSRSASQRIFYLRNRPCLGTTAATASTATTAVTTAIATAGVEFQRYSPPDCGKVRVRLIEGFHPPETNVHNLAAAGTALVGTNALSYSMCRHIIRTAESSTNPLCLLFYGIDCSHLYFEESKLLYENALGKTDDAIGALCVIVRRMRVPADAMKLVRHFVGSDVMKWRRLKQRLGTTLNPLLGLASGYYRLDLGFELDRTCLKRLIEMSIAAMERRLESGKWDTSQTGKWSCFRNEFHPIISSASGAAADGVATATGVDAAGAVHNANISISPEHFNPLPNKGKLEFDFISTSRPDPQLNRPIADDAIIDLLLISRLIDDSNIAPALRFLGDWAKASRKSVLADGSPHWKADLGTAAAASDACYAIYSNLAARWKSQQRAQKRELIKSQSSSSPRKTRSVDASTKQRGVLNRMDSTGSGSGSVSGGVAGGGSSSKGALKNAAANRRAIAVAEANQLVAEKESANNRRKNMEMVLNSLRCGTFRDKALQLNSSWSKRLYEVLCESTGTNEYKALAVMEFFELVLPSLWLLCRQLALILASFKVGVAQKSLAGSYRVELVVLLFDRIVDLHNFEAVLSALSAEEQGALRARIGILNHFNPCKMEGAWQLDMRRWDERQVVKMMIHLSVVEPGENWLNKSYIFDYGFLPVPGWDLSVVWLAEEGLPKKGILSAEIFAGAGMNQLGCVVDSRLRQLLCSLVLVEQRDLADEIERSENQKIQDAIKRQRAKRQYTTAGGGASPLRPEAGLDGGDSLTLDMSTVGSLTSATSMQTQSFAPFADNSRFNTATVAASGASTSFAAVVDSSMAALETATLSVAEDVAAAAVLGTSQVLTPKSAVMMQQSYGLGGGFAIGVVAGGVDTSTAPIKSSSFDGTHSSTPSHRTGAYVSNAFDGRKRNNTCAPYDAETGVFEDETPVIVKQATKAAALTALLQQIHLLPLIAADEQPRPRSAQLATRVNRRPQSPSFSPSQSKSQLDEGLGADADCSGDVKDVIPELRRFSVQFADQHLSENTEITWNYTGDNGGAVLDKLLRGWRH